MMPTHNHALEPTSLLIYLNGTLVPVYSDDLADKLIVTHSDLQQV